MLKFKTYIKSQTLTESWPCLHRQFWGVQNFSKGNRDRGSSRSWSQKWGVELCCSLMIWLGSNKGRAVPNDGKSKCFLEMESSLENIGESLWFLKETLSWDREISHERSVTQAHHCHLNKLPPSPHLTVASLISQQPPILEQNPQLTAILPLAEGFKTEMYTIIDTVVLL